MTEINSDKERTVQPSNKASSTEVRLTLEDGTEMKGQSFGAVAPIAGEVVFNTGMTGYVETLTDPSYRGQILVCTYPLIGNYGVPAPRPAGSIDGPYESSVVQVQGLVIQHYINKFSHHNAARSLSQWLRQENTPGVTGIDTRTLTRRLREHGTMAGWLYPATMEFSKARQMAVKVDMKKEVFGLVAPTDVINYPGGNLRILLIDVGAKDNMVRSLLKRGTSVRRIPWHAKLAKHAEDADGIIIGNGPGDPTDLEPLVLQIRALLDTYRKPIFGICLGNQILALAAGGETYKLPYGHRGVNQPVQDLLSRKCFITSQNHGYAVRDEALPKDWEPWFVNINDGTNEGIRASHHPYFSVQFHPEANPGPKDTEFLFDDFLRLVASMKIS